MFKLLGYAILSEEVKQIQKSVYKLNFTYNLHMQLWWWYRDHFRNNMNSSFINAVIKKERDGIDLDADYPSQSWLFSFVVS